jgi:hypothetical protein
MTRLELLIYRHLLRRLTVEYMALVMMYEEKNP